MSSCARSAASAASCVCLGVRVRVCGLVVDGLNSCRRLCATWLPYIYRSVHAAHQHPICTSAASCSCKRRMAAASRSKKPPSSAASKEARGEPLGGLFVVVCFEGLGWVGVGDEVGVWCEQGGEGGALGGAVRMGFGGVCVFLCVERRCWMDRSIGSHTLHTCIIIHTYTIKRQTHPPPLPFSSGPSHSDGRLALLLL